MKYQYRITFFRVSQSVTRPTFVGYPVCCGLRSSYDQYSKPTTLDKSYRLVRLSRVYASRNRELS